MGTQQAAECGQLVAHTLRSEGHDASEDGTGRGVPLVAATLRSRQVASPGVSMPGRGGEDDQNLLVEPLLVCVLDIKTGKTALDKNWDWHWWTQGNGSCDCNRQRLFGQDKNTGYCLGCNRYVVVFVNGERAGPEFNAGYPTDPSKPVVYNPHRTLQKDGSVAEGFKPDEITDALHGPTGNKEPLIAYQCQGTNVGEMGTLRAGNGNETGGVPFLVQDEPAFAIQERAISENIENGPQGKGWQEEQAFTLEARHHQQAVAKKGVRRLTPTECCRLQGFADDWLDGLSDSAKYRLLGNAVSVPVSFWIGKRLVRLHSV